MDSITKPQRRSKYRGGYSTYEEPQTPRKPFESRMSGLPLAPTQKFFPNDFGESIYNSGIHDYDHSFELNRDAIRRFGENQEVDFYNATPSPTISETSDLELKFMKVCIELEAAKKKEQQLASLFNADEDDFDVRNEYFWAGGITNHIWRKYDAIFREYQESKMKLTPTYYEPERVHQTVNEFAKKLGRPREYSNKVFVGGISPKMDRALIEEFFSSFGDVYLDWPSKTSHSSKGRNMFSYLFLVYPDERSVHRLLAKCTTNRLNEHFVSIQYNFSHSFKVQVRPWRMDNCEYIASDIPADKKCVDTQNTVFVGGLPRIVTANEIAAIFTKFGKVLLVNIDVDQDYGYPKGAARVSFEKYTSAQNALDERFLRLHDIDSNKTTVEIKPYLLEDVPCDQCGGLWYNSMAAIVEGLTECRDQCSYTFSSLHWKNDRMKRSLFYDRTDEIPEENDKYTAARKIIELANFFRAKTSNIDYSLWDIYAPSPVKKPMKVETCSIDQMLDRLFRKECRTTVVHNKSCFCPTKSCRQHYCPSCHHFYHNNAVTTKHVPQATSRNDNRPRKDKPMYLVSGC